MTGPAPALADGHAATQPAAHLGTTFDFTDPKGVNAVAVFIDSKLEPIMGVASGVTGKVTYNPEDPTSFTGQITVDATSLQLSSDRMTKVMAGADWLGLSEHAHARFTFNEVAEVKEKDGETHLHVKGVFESAGVSLEKTAWIQVDHFPDAAKDRGGAESGDLLKLTSMFKVDRTELGIKPEMGPDVVGHSIDIKVAIVGYSQ